MTFTKNNAFLPKIKKDTEKEIKKLLSKANDEITLILSKNPSDFNNWHYENIKKEIKRVGIELEGNMSHLGQEQIIKSYNEGIDLFDNPLKEKIKGVLLPPRIETDSLMKMKSFMTDKMRDLSVTTVDKVNSELGLVLLGVKTPYEVMKNVSNIIEGEEKRASRIVKTELGRVYSMATYDRMTNANKYFKELGASAKLRKQWRRSGKIHSRLSHDLADGQIVDVDDYFLIGSNKLLYPRDPAAPIEEVINCGCILLPIMPSWEVLHPKESPFTDDEYYKSKQKRYIDEARGKAFNGWVDYILKNKRAGGSFETVGSLTPEIKKALEIRGINYKTTEVALSDRRVLHMTREAKEKRGSTISEASVKKIPDIINNPRNVYLDKKDNSLIYEFEERGKNAKIVLKISKEDKKVDIYNHNWIITSGVIDADALKSNLYEKIL